MTFSTGRPSSGKYAAATGVIDTFSHMDGDLEMTRCCTGVLCSTGVMWNADGIITDSDPRQFEDSRVICTLILANILAFILMTS